MEIMLIKHLYTPTHLDGLLRNVWVCGFRFK